MLCWKMLSEIPCTRDSILENGVLILVVLEDAIGVVSIVLLSLKLKVLILVVLEDAIGD